MTEEIKKIIIISDGTGKTAKRLMDAVLAQYREKEVNYSVEKIYQQVRTKIQLNDIIEVVSNDYLVIFSLISRRLQKYFENLLNERGFLYLNVLEPMLNIMSKFLGVHPDFKPGLLQIVDDRYYRKIDAIGYTVEHDDGQGTHIEDANVVLLGVSRTCKTPISMYLACNFGLKAVNIPIVSNESVTDGIAKRIEGLPQHIIFGLTMKPEVLMLVREERSYNLSHDPQVQKSLKSYHDLRAVREEMKFSLRFFDTNHWDTIDVTKRAIEEISTEILHKLKRMV